MTDDDINTMIEGLAGRFKVDQPLVYYALSAFDESSSKNSQTDLKLLETNVICRYAQFLACRFESNTNPNDHKIYYQEVSTGDLVDPKINYQLE